MKPRDTPCLWKYGLLYAWAAGALIIGAASLPSPPAILLLAFAAAVTWRCARKHLAWLRSDMRPLRRTLAALVAERLPDADLWLHRDDHQAFQLASRGPSWFRRWSVVRLPEDTAREYAGNGQVFAGYEIFACLPVEQYVYRRQDAVLVRPGSDGEPEVQEPESPRLPVRVWRNHRMERTGMLYASTGEVADLIRQLKDSEPLGKVSDLP